MRLSGYWSATAVVTGENYGCFLRADQKVFCFGTEASMGLNRAGMLATSEPLAMSVGDPSSEGYGRAWTIAAGPHHACARSTSAVSCWGQNDRGQLGNGTTLDSKQPVEVHFPQGSE